LVGKRMLDVQKIRGDFPILSSGIIYLDNAASSLTPDPVIDKMLAFYHEYRANVERGVHRLSRKASDELAATRARICKFINAASEAEVIFTKNTTESINLVARGLGWKKGDKVVTTLLEHHSNLIVWQRLRRLGVEVNIIRPNVEGIFNLRDFEEAIDDKTKLVALTHISNVLGTLLPVEKISELAREHDAEVLIDAAQSAPHMAINIKTLGCDYLAFSGHKMLGPTGVGVLYAREDKHCTLEPLCIGGGSIEEVTLDGYKLAKSPARFEAGTPPIAEVIGLGAAVDYLTKIGFDAIAEHEKSLVRSLHRGLVEIPKVEVYGPTDVEQRVGIVPFNVKGLNPHDIAAILDNSANIMVRSGHHCAMPLHKELLGQPEGTVRASVYIYNTLEEIKKLVDTVREISESLV